MDNKQWLAWLEERTANLHDGLHEGYQEEPLLCPNCQGTYYSQVRIDNQHAYECADCGQNFYSINGEIRLL